MNALEALADSAVFIDSQKIQQAEMIVWALAHAQRADAGVSLNSVQDAFVALHLPKQNLTRIRNGFRLSRNIRVIATDVFAPSREFSKWMSESIALPKAVDEEVFSLAQIIIPPFVEKARVDDLKAMMRAYAHLFLMENSIRELIASTLHKKLGENWWDQAASASMKRKHDERTENEGKKKWAPTRAEFGPLYALDWPDLVTLMRKYESEFEPVIKDIKFLHKLEDLGSYRNVVAHNGALRDEDDFNLIRIYYSHWVKQTSP